MGVTWLPWCLVGSLALVLWERSGGLEVWLSQRGMDADLEFQNTCAPYLSTLQAFSFLSPFTCGLPSPAFPPGYISLVLLSLPEDGVSCIRGT